MTWLVVIYWSIGMIVMLVIGKAQSPRGEITLMDVLLTAFLFWFIWPIMLLGAVLYRLLGWTERVVLWPKKRRGET